MIEKQRVLELSPQSDALQTLSPHSPPLPSQPRALFHSASLCSRYATLRLAVRLTSTLHLNLLQPLFTQTLCTKSPHAAGRRICLDSNHYLFVNRFFNQYLLIIMHIFIEIYQTYSIFERKIKKFKKIIKKNSPKNIPEFFWRPSPPPPPPPCPPQK